MIFIWFEEHLDWFLKLHPDFLELWLFCRISVISEFLFLGIGFKTKIRVPQKISIFQLFLLKLYQIHFCVCLCLFLLAEFVIPLFNYFFRDFSGFCDFRVFDLAGVFPVKLANVFNNTLLYITPVAASDLSFVQIPKFPGHYSSVSTIFVTSSYSSYVIWRNHYTKL